MIYHELWELKSFFQSRINVGRLSDITIFPLLMCKKWSWLSEMIIDSKKKTKTIFSLNFIKDTYWSEEKKKYWKRESKTRIFHNFPLFLSTSSSWHLSSLRKVSKRKRKRDFLHNFGIMSESEQMKWWLWKHFWNSQLFIFKKKNISSVVKKFLKFQNQITSAV